MSDNEQPDHYFDIGTTSKESGDSTSDGPFGSDMRLASLSDVEAGRADFFNDLMISARGSFGNISGVEAFTQSLVLGIMDESLSLEGIDLQAEADLELEFEQIALDHPHVTAVEDVTVGSSNRPYEKEIKMSMTVSTQDARYTTELFLGETDAVDVTE